MDREKLSTLKELTYGHVVRRRLLSNFRKMVDKEEWKEGTAAEKA